MSSQESFSLYIHIPYCVRKCPYCDFNIQVVRKIPEDDYTQALLDEIDFYAAGEEWQGRCLKSIYFGGGTPSLFRPSSIGKILEKAASLFTLEEKIEISLEANPEAEDRTHFAGYRACGVNRLSLGVQSFQPRLLKFLGRLHSADDARETLRAGQEAGFESLSLDLIYASPGQTVTDLESDLNEALRFDPPHLSAYNLTIEEKTVFYRESRAGRIQNLAEEDEIAMAALIEERLANARLKRYEISNFARPGFDSRHNLNYWQGGDYLGLGAGAHSHCRNLSGDLFAHRWSNERNPVRYMGRIRQDRQAVVDREEIDLRKSAAEFMFLGLRMTQGIAVDTFTARFGKNPIDLYPRISDWIEGGFMEVGNGHLFLTRRGLMVANSIFVHFV